MTKKTKSKSKPTLNKPCTRCQGRCQKINPHDPFKIRHHDIFELSNSHVSADGTYKCNFPEAAIIHAKKSDSTQGLWMDRQYIKDLEYRAKRNTLTEDELKKAINQRDTYARELVLLKEGKKNLGVCAVCSTNLEMSCGVPTCVNLSCDVGRRCANKSEHDPDKIARLVHNNTASIIQIKKDLDRVISIIDAFLGPFKTFFETVTKERK